MSFYYRSETNTTFQKEGMIKHGGGNVVVWWLLFISMTWMTCS